MEMREFEYFVQICEPGSLSAMYQFRKMLGGHPSMMLEVETFGSRFNGATLRRNFRHSRSNAGSLLYFCFVQHRMVLAILL